MKSAMKNITIKANRTLCGIGALALILSASTAQAASLITNGDFELITGGDGGDATGWTKVGAYGIYDGVSNLNGPGTVFGSWAYVPGNGEDTSDGVYQTLTTILVAGMSYTLSFQANPWVSGGSSNIRVGNYNSGSYDSDASYSSLSLSVIDTPTTHTAWTLRSYTFTALGGEDTVYFGSALNSGLTPGSGSGYDIDNVSLVAVPEPSAALLGGLGLLALLRRRRR
jgi:hypothetical protein